MQYSCDSHCLISISHFRLFEKNQNLKNLFSAFRDIDPNDMRSSQVLENHAMMVMCTIDDAICCLDDLNYVREQLHTVGKSHRRFKNFKPEIFFVSLFEFIDEHFEICLIIIHKV